MQVAILTDFRFALLARLMVVGVATAPWREITPIPCVQTKAFQTWRPVLDSGLIAWFAAVLCDLFLLGEAAPNPGSMISRLLRRSAYAKCRRDRGSVRNSRLGCQRGKKAALALYALEMSDIKSINVDNVRTGF